MKGKRIKEKWFKEWLVGFTDGDGSFKIIESNKKWTLIYEITQSKNNMKVINYIKRNMKVGKINKVKKKIIYRVRKIEDIINKVIPIFEEKKLITNKEYNYKLFKKASEIIKKEEIPEEEKNKELKKIKEKIKKKEIVKKYVPESNKSIENIQKEMTKPWLIGYIEAKGSINIRKKEEKRFVHEFGITNKINKIILEGIRKKLKIKAKVIEKKNVKELRTSNSRSIEKIIKYLENEMKGKKSWEMKLWARSYRKYKGNNKKLKEIRERIRRIVESKNSRRK